MNLHDYEYRIGQGVRTDISADMHESLVGDTAERLANMAGLGRRNVYYLLAVRRNRPDLYEKVFEGNYAIGRAYAEMKRDESPPTTEDER